MVFGNGSSNITSSEEARVQPHGYPPQHALSHKVISSIAILVLIILTLLGNGLVIAAFYIFKRIRNSVTNWFILSLAVSDIMVAIITEPIWLAGEITTWMYPREIDVVMFALLWTMIDIVCAISSISNLMFISIDRYFAIKHPLVHHTRMTTTTCKYIILATWIHAVLTSCLFLIEQNWKYLVIFLSGFVFPLLIILFCYGGILSVVARRSRRAKRHGRRLSNEFKTARSLSVVTGAFVICWLPFFLTSLTYHYCEVCKEDIDRIPAIRAAVVWLHYLNSCLNPIIYAFLNPTFKLAFRNLIRRMCGKGYLYSPEIESSMSLRGRRDTYNGSLRRSQSGKSTKQETEKAPNGVLSSHHKPLLNPYKTKMNGKVHHESISEDGSAERGIETPDDEQRSLKSDQICLSTSPPSYDCHQLQTAPSHNGVKTSCDDVDQHNDSSKGLSAHEPCLTPKERNVPLFETPLEFFGERNADKMSPFEDSSSLPGHFSTYHDKERNKTYLLIDGITVPDNEIRTTDV